MRGPWKFDFFFSRTHSPPPHPRTIISDGRRTRGEVFYCYVHNILYGDNRRGKNRITLTAEIDFRPRSRRAKPHTPVAKITGLRTARPAGTLGARTTARRYSGHPAHSFLPSETPPSPDRIVFYYYYYLFSTDFYTVFFFSFSPVPLARIIVWKTDVPYIIRYVRRSENICPLMTKELIKSNSRYPRPGPSTDLITLEPPKNIRRPSAQITPGFFFSHHSFPVFIY